MLEKKQDLYNALQQESKVLQTKFAQISAETIYYTFLNKQVKKDKFTPNSFNNLNSNEHKSEQKSTQDCKHSDITSNHNAKYNQKICKDNNLNKSKLICYSLANEYSFMKSKNDCEFKEGFYKMIALNSINKLNKTNINNATKQMQNVRGHNKKLILNDTKEVKMKLNNSMNKTGCLHVDINTKLGKSGGEQHQLIQALKKDHCLMNWKKNAENAEFSLQEHFTKKEEMKRDKNILNTKQRSIEKQNKIISPKLQFVIQKSLSNDYRHCLKQKKDREDDEIFYQSMNTIPLSTSKSKVVSKSKAKRINCKKLLLPL